MLDIERLTKAYPRNGDVDTVLEDISFTVRAGEFVSLVGPSGCGKTTLLTILAGLGRPTSGRVLLSGTEVVGPPKGLVLVFQNYAGSLFPWRTVLGNVLFALEGTTSKRTAREAKARAALASVGLADCAGHYPFELSGGMQQRLTLARALAHGAEVLLMDEPFASVDAQTRADLEDLLLGIRDRHQKTVLFITHDIDEAVYLSDRVLVLGGRPAGIRAEIEVALPRPRDQIATRKNPRFMDLRGDIQTLLRG